MPNPSLWEAILQHGQGVRVVLYGDVGVEGFFMFFFLRFGAFPVVSWFSIGFP